MNRKVATVASTCAFVVGGIGAAAAYGFANPDANGRAATAPGQIHAIENCDAVIDKQNANGQVKDSTIGPTAVTNCDHFWQFQP